MILKIIISDYYPSPSPSYYGYARYWIDLIDGTTWAHNAENVTYSNWRFENYAIESSCTYVYLTFKWVATTCGVKVAYICEK